MAAYLGCFKISDRLALSDNVLALLQASQTKTSETWAVDFLLDAENYPCLQRPYQLDRADTRDNSRAKFIYAGVDGRE